MRDRIGLAFFTFASVLSFLAAWEHPVLLTWLAAIHNSVLAALYIRRRPPVKYDRTGLFLGILAAVLPLTTVPSVKLSYPLVFIGILGYTLVFWSLISLSNRFGIAPADRELVVRGPYRIVRHPMYLGELVLRSALVAASPHVLLAVSFLIILAVIQILRALREEHILTGYDAYTSRVPYRLVPGVW
jgi:protein-S-isoprenylcysteine O-methyltransferase Ste14